MSKYAPANTAGEKPYVVTMRSWGRERSKLVYADSATSAKYLAFGRLGTGEYITSTRRATAADLPTQDA